jgi:hypothetical protein
MELIFALCLVLWLFGLLGHAVVLALKLIGMAAVPAAILLLVVVVTAG